MLVVARTEKKVIDPADHVNSGMGRLSSSAIITVWGVFIGSVFSCQLKNQEARKVSGTTGIEGVESETQ